MLTGGIFLYMFATITTEAKLLHHKKALAPQSEWKRHLVDVSQIEKSKKIRYKNRIRMQLAYFSSNNFVGRPIDGYKANKCLLSMRAAQALLKAQKSLLKKGYSLIAFDCYRPQKAVNEFVKWCQDSSDISTKQKYYPNIPSKQDLLKLEYIASKSGHSRGSTVDLGLVYLRDESLVDMGTPFDFFGEESHTLFAGISPQQKENRSILLKAMESAQFMNFEKEWWHFTLRKEPYPKNYFDYDIK